MTTFRAALAEARAMLGRAGVPNAGLDARLLMSDAAGIATAALIAREGEELPDLAEAAFQSHLNRRLAGAPVARILGEKEFWGLPFRVSEATLVPRPETEILVEIVLGYARSRTNAAIGICDLGTGTGAILVALLSELPWARGAAVDISQAALEIARNNAERLGVLTRISFHHADFGNAPDGPFDVVVSNPPYVRSGAIAGLQPEVREHDPRVALDGGPDGLGAYRSILARAPSILKEDGLLALEVGHDQGAAVAALCRAVGFGGVAVSPDLAGTDRMVSGRWGTV